MGTWHWWVLPFVPMILLDVIPGNDGCERLQVSGPVFFSSLVSEKLLRTHVIPPLDGCTYLGLDSGAPPLQVTPVGMGSLIISHKSYFILFNISTDFHPDGLGTPQLIVKPAHSSVSSSDFLVPGCAQVPLLRCDSGPLCEGGTTWLQFPRRPAGGASEARQGRAVEDLERNSPHCGWVNVFVYIYR